MTRIYHRARTPNRMKNATTSSITCDRYSYNRYGTRPPIRTTSTGIGPSRQISNRGRALVTEFDSPLCFFYAFSLDLQPVVVQYGRLATKTQDGKHTRLQLATVGFRLARIGRQVFKRWRHNTISTSRVVPLVGLSALVRVCVQYNTLTGTTTIV